MINWQEVQNLDPMPVFAISLLVLSLYGLYALQENDSARALLGLLAIFLSFVSMAITFVIMAILFVSFLMYQSNPDKPVKNVEHTCTVQPDKTKIDITEIKPEKISITTTCR